MNNKLAKASIAGVAALTLAAGTSTWAAFSDFGSIKANSVGAGILKLELTSDDGGEAIPLDFGNLAPGTGGGKAVYVASSSGDSVPDADLFLTLENVKNYDQGCQSASESKVDPNCGGGDDGTEGDLAKVLDMRIETYSAPDANVCKGYLKTDAHPEGDDEEILVPSVIPNVTGNMADAGNLNTQLKLNVAPLEPTDGVCVLFFTYWPGNAGVYDADNAAQGDAIKFDAKFDLEQHFAS